MQTCKPDVKENDINTDITNKALLKYALSQNYAIKHDLVQADRHRYFDSKYELMPCSDF